MSDTYVSKEKAQGEEMGAMAKVGVALADWSERWFPDAYVFAAIAVVLVAVIALFLGRTPMQVANDFGHSFWSLVPFTMQMAFVIITGYVVAVSKPVKKVLLILADVPKTPRFAVGYVGLIAMLASLICWGFSLVLAAFLSREISKRVKGVDYRAIGAAGYLGLCSIWALGLSSSAALMMATKSSIPPALYKISGTIGLEQTLFNWQNLVMILVLMGVSFWIAYASAPTAEHAKTAEMAGLIYKDEEEEVEPKASTPGEYLEYSPILTIFMALLGFGYLFTTFSTKGGLSALDLNNYTFMLLIVGMLFHWTPHNFLKACGKAIPMSAGVFIQFPLYAGIFGMLMGSGLNEILANFFVSISTKETLPVTVGIYSALAGLLLPSGGGKWVVEAPYVLEAANQLKCNLAWIVQVYNAAEALPNFINPFWMLPLLGVAGMKARDLAGFAMLQFFFHVPIVLLLLYFLGLTHPYIPPIMQ